MAGYEGMTPQFAAALQAMIAASGGRLHITSGYRSPAHQQQLFDAAVRKYGSVAAARKWVAPPGKSNHNKGLAADLAGDLKWAHANAARFGLVFPLKNEAWHTELVGARSARSAGSKGNATMTDPVPSDAATTPMTDLEDTRLKDPMVQVSNLLAFLASEGDAAGATETF